MKKLLLSLITIVAILSFSFMLVHADVKVSIDLVDGVQIRTDENAGLKWQAVVSEHVEGATYGMLFGQGERTVDQMTHENIAVLDLYDSATKAAVIDELKEVEGKLVFEVTMKNFPKYASVQDIAVIAYAKVNDEYIYNCIIRLRNA